MDEAQKVGTDELTLAVNRLWEDRTHADLTIICLPRQWKVHKAILCSRSEFFKAACQPGRFKEGRDNVITLPSHKDDLDVANPELEGIDDPDAINVLIYHLYHPNTDYTTLSENASMELHQHAWVFAAAEKYNLKGLKLQAVHHARSLLSRAPTDEGIQLQMAEAIEAIYTGTAETVTDMRHCMTSALLRDQGKRLKVPAIREAIEGIPGLTYSLLETKAVDVLGIGVPTCSICESGSKHIQSEDGDDDNDDAAGCDDPEAINVLLYHLYHPSTKYRDLDASGKGMTLVLHVRVFAAADKYGLQALQMQASDFAHEIMNQRDPNSELQDQMIEALKPIYTETPETAISLRRSMNSVLWRYNGELLKSPPFQAAIEAVPGLAYELLLTKANDDFDYASVLWL
ncbi:hypothetical protein KC356_g4419 [Hortaea werneckii]|nr:hypothetical protein KC356_g4419 [Hortaea werneckii]